MDASIVRGRVLRGEYRDSMVLMYLSAKLGKIPGVLKAAALMGTEANKSLLSVMDLALPEADDAGPNDLVVSVRGASADAVSAALARLEEMLAERVSIPVAGETFFHSIETAAQALPGANLAVI